MEIRSKGDRANKIVNPGNVIQGKCEVGLRGLAFIKHKFDVCFFVLDIELRNSDPFSLKIIRAVIL